MNNELAVEILKQATIETTTGACEKCPRKDKNKTCIGCLDEAKEIILSEVERLGNELQVQIEDNTRLNEYIEEQDKKLQQKENIIKEVIEDNKKLKEENKALKILCNKYEEEHNTTFEEWKKTINIINELKEWFKGYHKSYASCKWYEEDYIEFIEHLEEELKGSDKE